MAIRALDAANKWDSRTMMTSEMAMIRIVTTAGLGSCGASLDGVRNTPDTRDAFLPVSLYYFRRR